jgi:hypothetical protein
MKTSQIMLLIALAGLYLQFKASGTLDGRTALRYWIDPATGVILDAPGVTPPRPGMRPASETELAQANITGGGYL